MDIRKGIRSSGCVIASLPPDLCSNPGDERDRVKKNILMLGKYTKESVTFLFYVQFNGNMILKMNYELVTKRALKIRH